MHCEHDAFLAAIHNDPEDDTPRLVYADYLQEHGDPVRTARAEFIRCQIWLESREAEGQQRDQWRRVATRLLKEYGHRWVTPARGCDGGPPPEGLADWSFRRGFIESITVDAERFDAAGMPVFDKHPVREVRFQGFSGPESARRVANSPLLTRVEVMRLGRAGFHERGLTDEGLAELLACRYLTHLRALDVDGQRLTNAAATRLDRCPGLPRLRSLRLSQHRPNAVWNQNLELESLERLLLSPPFAGVRSLELDNLNLGTKGGAFVASVLGRGIDQLSVRRCDLGDAGVEILVEGGNLSGLRKLDLRQNRLGVQACEALASSPLTALGELLLASNPLEDEGVSALAATAWNLQTLSLRRTRISDQAVDALTADGRFPELAELDMVHDRVTPEGAARLARGYGLPALRMVDLRRNRIYGSDRNLVRDLGGARVQFRL